MVEFNTHMDPKGVMVCDGGDFRWIYLSLKAQTGQRSSSIARIYQSNLPKFLQDPKSTYRKKNTPSTRCHKMSGCIPWIYLSSCNISTMFHLQKKRYFDLQICWRNVNDLTKPPGEPVSDTTPETPAGSLGRRCRPAGRHLKPRSAGAQGFPTTSNSDLSVTYLRNSYGLPIYIIYIFIYIYYIVYNKHLSNFFAS